MAAERISRRSPRRRYKASIEDVAISWVIAALREEGHDVEDIWSPDRDLSRRPELRRRPDCAVMIDDQPAAIEVTMFTSEDEAEAGARVADTQAIVTDILWASYEWGGLSPLSLVLFDPAKLAGTSRNARSADAALLGRKLAAAVGGAGEMTSARLDDMRGLPGWVLSISMTVTNQLQPPRADVILMAPRGEVTRRVDNFVAGRIKAKGSQHDGWGLGILAIMHGVGEKAEDLRTGFARCDAHPWWRVYWIDREPPPELVSESSA